MSPTFMRWLSQAPWPSIAVEIAADRVTAVEVRTRSGGATVRSHAIETLSPGLVKPSLTSSNIADVARVSRTVVTAISRMAGRHQHVGLVLPDAAAKVSLIRFDAVPDRAEDLRELIAWQLRKSVPFDVADAQLSYSPGARLTGGGREFAVVIARRDVVAEYEAVCTQAGVKPGVVDVASLNLINLVLAGSPRAGTDGDWLLVHVEPDYTTIAIVRAGALVFYRNSLTPTESDLADFVHQTAMYYEDRLEGAGFGRVILAGAGDDSRGADALRDALSARIHHEVEAIDPRAAATLKGRRHIDQATLDAIASPTGLLVRRRAA